MLPAVQMSAVLAPTDRRWSPALFSEAQLMPDSKPSASVTSTIFASSITCRSIDSLAKLP